MYLGLQLFGAGLLNLTKKQVQALLTHKDQETTPGPTSNQQPCGVQESLPRTAEKPGRSLPPPTLGLRLWGAGLTLPLPSGPCWAQSITFHSLLSHTQPSSTSMEKKPTWSPPRF